MSTAHVTRDALSRVTVTLTLVSMTLPASKIIFTVLFNVTFVMNRNTPYEHIENHIFIYFQLLFYNFTTSIYE